MVDEKIRCTTGQPPRSIDCHDDSRLRTRRSGWWLVSVLAILVLFTYPHVPIVCHHFPGTLGVKTSQVSKCPQVEPMKPGQKSEALDRMDAFLLSEKFKNASVGRLAGAIRIPSESFDDLGPIGKDKRWNIMYKVAKYLKQTFPLVHTTLHLEKVNTHGLLYTWEGSDSSLKPTVLMAHQDVVPVAKSTVSQWTHPPFSGTFDGKYVWGRGAGDCKNTLIGILEAVELLVEAGFKPKRTLILSFGFDEEISGKEGAGHLAPFLLERYGKGGVAVIIDEGAGIASTWGTHFAYPGVAEKGYIDVEIVVRMPGGHSSIPPAHSGIGVMSELITLIEAHPYKPRLHDKNPYLGLMECGAEHSPDFPENLKKLLSRRGKGKRGSEDKLAEEAAKESPFIKYLFTTSIAVDVIGGGVKVNALPERTRAIVNHRVNVGDSSKVVEEKITKLAATVAQKYNLTLNAFDGEAETTSSITLAANANTLEPAPVTPTTIDKSPYAVLSGTTRALYGEEIITAPGMMTGNTDTRYYWDLTPHIFRFVPGWDPDEDMWSGIHTVDEKISMLTHVRAVQWFTMFVRNMDEADLN